MKILMLASATPHSSLSHRSIAMGRELVKLGHTVTMIAPSFDRHSHWKIDKPAKMYGLKMIYPFQFKSRSFLINLVPYMLGASFCVLANSADVVCLYKPTPATIPALLSKWFKRTPVVLELDDLGSEVMEIEGHPRMVYGLVAYCERLAAKQSAAIVGVSRLLVDDLTSKFPNKQVMRIPNGVDPKEFIPKAPAVGRRPRIIFFAVLARTRILAPLLEALPAVIEKVGSDSVDLEILGDGPKRGELESIARKLNISENVHFRGWTTFDQLDNYIASGDIAISIMPDERTTAACSNQKVFQYQALELATIVTRVGDLPIYVENGEAGVVVEAGDKEALANAVISLLEDSKRREALSKRARKLAETKYSWSNLAGQFEQLLERVA